MGWAGYYASAAEETLPFSPRLGPPGGWASPSERTLLMGAWEDAHFLQGPCLGGLSPPATPLGLHNAKADRSVFHHVLSLPFPQFWGPPPRSQVVRSRSCSRPWGKVGQGLLTCTR